ncbi:hypothetical protein [Streptomyces sp. NPDC006552]|uniref:hypothetical protein n=1 Tax=Streptomyces sp. NPDC006552 TaxID=3157179 RepID=UPI0033A254F1
MIHSEESVAAELDRVRQRPTADVAPPALAAFTAELTQPFPDYADRVREVLAAALYLASTAEFDDEDLPTDRFPEWFARVSSRNGEPPAEFARDGRAAFLERSGKQNPWSLQNWIYRFDPDEESRGWEFWDIAQTGTSQARIWVDSWGESSFGSLDLLWLLYTAGAARVEGPQVHKPAVWVSEAFGR